MYRLILSNEAQRVYADADAPLARKLAKCFSRLEVDPRTGSNVKSLRGPLAGHLRYRVGGHRVIYRIDDSPRIVTVVTIAHRRDVYD